MCVHVSESVCECVCVCVCVCVWSESQWSVCVCVGVSVCVFNLMQHPDVNKCDLSGRTRPLWLRDAVVF